MANVSVPSLMRDLTGGEASVDGSGATVAEVLHDLEARYPGFAQRLLVGDDLDPALIVVVDDHPASLGLSARVRVDSRIRFLPAVGGG
jgi:sulfur-carrier protein